MEATYASCKKVLPKVYCDSLAALLSGKYLVEEFTFGYVSATTRSKLA